MAEPPARQGWRVPFRTPVIGAAALLAMVAVLLVIAGRVYRARLAPERMQPVQTFPAPGIETYVHDGQADARRPTQPIEEDPQIAAAKQAVVAEGIAGWPR